MTGISFTNAKMGLLARGLSLTKRDGEYRVAFNGRGNEASASYTDDLDDAYATGLAMAAHRDNTTRA